jgi:hypothetical protein
MFPVAPQRDADSDVLAVTGMDTLELVSRLQRSDLDPATLDALRIMADRLCSEYPSMPPDQLLTEGRAWLRRITALQGQRVTEAAPGDLDPGRVGGPAGGMRRTRHG